MRALDFTPDRLGAAKETLREFAEGRPTDRIGLVTFAREAYTACPLTIDHEALLAVADDIPFARREEDGTAIGLGLGAAVSRLQASEATSRVIVLVTDGVNNSGSISPLTAAELARESAIKVYTIGVGTRGLARMPRITPSGRTVIRPEPVEIDEETLRSIAEMTGGSYFRADNDGALDEIFGEIDALEKSDIESDLYVSWEDRFAPLLIAAALVLLLEVGVARFLFWRVP